MSSAIITGCNGQDGSYLIELLLSRGYEVHGVVRRASTNNLVRIEHLLDKIILHYGDMTSGESINRLIYEIQPDEFYHLAAQSQVKVSFDLPEFTGNITGLSTTRILESIRTFKLNTRFYNAASSEMFGNSPPPQNENSLFVPESPYAAAKLYSYNITKIYRNGYNLFAANGILFNHESPRRGEEFVTKKIAKGVADIEKGKIKYITLGNIEARRDWGYAPEYVEAMWRILQQDNPDDFVIGTGETHSVREFLEEAFSYINKDWYLYTKIDINLFRPNEVNNLLADASKAQKILHWKPKVTFKELVRIMVQAELDNANKN